MVSVMKLRIRLSAYDWILSLLPLLFFAANFYRMVTEKNMMYLVCLIAVGLIGWIVYLMQANKSVLLVSVTFMFFLALNVVIIETASINSLINEVCLLGITFLLVLKVQTVKQTSVLLWLTVVVFVYAWITGIHRSDILISSSNYVSILLILHACIYYCSLERNKDVVRILPALACFALSLWAAGRSGIVCSGLLCIGVILLYIKSNSVNERRKRCLYFLIFILIFISVVTEFNVLSFDTISPYLQKFQTKGIDNSDRIVIWSEYLEDTYSSIKYILFGTPIEEVSSAMIFNGNLHNSYLQLHSTHGLVVFAVFFVLLIRAFVYYINNTQYLHVLMLSVLCLRAFFDKFIFLQYGMPVMMYFVLVPLVYKKRNREKMT